ncbi:DUF1835 domain-containing protein [Jannaschia sp. 2305UL9-9]|uniref:DUF1835 domain-containing protein n=1 Tax=Jannaschia sp. 2305UL9-9 TaxID=3121638 RepID=UPI003526CA6D
MADLHITNGDGAAGILRQTGLCDRILPWRDPMHHGPFPAGLPLPEASKLRARYLAGPQDDAAQAQFEARDAIVQGIGRADHVILWFEHDLLDQLQILQILDHLSAAPPTRLELICIDRFPGVAAFRGIGQLSAPQMASLYDDRQAITGDMLDLARSGWAAFRSADPRDLLAFTRGDLAVFPFLAPALLRHLEDYPDRQTGLTRTEWQLLTLVAGGVHGPHDLFVRNMEREEVLYIGDWTTYAVLSRLCDAGLLRSAPHPFRSPPMDDVDAATFAGQRLNLTDAGRSILSGDSDAFTLLRRDDWLGGVRLRSERPMWTWDAGVGTLALRGG